MSCKIEVTGIIGEDLARRLAQMLNNGGAAKEVGIKIDIVNDFGEYVWSNMPTTEEVYDPDPRTPSTCLNDGM